MTSLSLLAGTLGRPSYRLLDSFMADVNTKVTISSNNIFLLIPVSHTFQRLEHCNREDLVDRAAKVMIMPMPSLPQTHQRMIGPPVKDGANNHFSFRKTCTPVSLTPL